ncbi:spermatogenesis associated 6-like protein isoform X2 [Carlito syrichta]|uniref:Spermatogenesis associated 6-like protein isoform X2 n=1 Tax=Carlito syrichta TaxID=1868482 RepID=A0A1U7TTU9_CARSF|nr:spermatogenesis associated 6-like protein isoform X2 [Carlito syrichta]
MPLEVVVELQIRAISCPGVFLPGKQDVYLGVYLLNQYVETNCFPSVFPIMIQQSMRFEKGIAPKIEFSTRTAIREPVSLHRNRFPEELYKSQRSFSTSHGPIFPLKNIKKRAQANNFDRLPKGMQSRIPSPYCTSHFFQDQPAQLNPGKDFRISGRNKPPFVVRHVDSAKPFGENFSEHHLRKSRRKLKFSNFPFPMRRASSLDSLAANVKVIKEPDERIFLRNKSPSPLGSSEFGKPSPGSQRGANFHRKTSFTTSQHSRSPSPLDQPLLQGRFHPSSQSTWKTIHERVCSLLTSHRAQQHRNKKDSTSEVNYILERPSYSLKKYPLHEQRYF